MVCKITSGKDIYGLLKYNEDKVSNREAEILGGSKIFGSHKGWENINFFEKMDSFAANLEANQRTEKVTFHVSLNPDPQDHLSNDQLKTIADDYMEKMGYGNQPYLIYKHNDIEREHIHIVSIRVDDKGVKIESDYEKLKSEAIRKDIENDYNLIKAQGKNDEHVSSLKNVFTSDVPGYGSLGAKAIMSGITKTIINDYMYGSFNELKTLLEVNGVMIRKVEGSRLDGSEIRGIQYQFIDQNNKLQGEPISSSKFGKDRGMKSIEAKILKNAPKLNNKNNKERIKKAVDTYFKNAPIPTLEGLKEDLSRYQIIPVYRINETGKLYGVSFIDKKEKTIYNGSKIGKDFSANRMEERFNAQLYPELNRHEKVITTDALNEGNADFSGIPISAIRYEALSKVLTEEQLKAAMIKLNTAYASQVLKETDNKTLPNILGALLENGIIIQPQTGKGSDHTFRMGYYKFPTKGTAPLGEELTKLLKDSNYNQNNFNDTINIIYRKNASGELKVSPKFDMIVKLNQAIRIKGNQITINKSLEFIDKINKPLYLEITNRPELIGKDPKGNFSKDQIRSIINTVSSYPSDSLRKPFTNDYKDYHKATSYTPGLKKLQDLKPAAGEGGIMSIFGSLFGSLLDTEYGNKEDHKENINRKKRRKRNL